MVSLAPIVPNLQSTAIAELDDEHEQVWPKSSALYEADPVLEPHKFQPGDWVYVRRFHQKHWSLGGRDPTSSC